MPQVSGLQFLETNAMRAYPLRDGVSQLDDAGSVFPRDLLVDLHLWFPDPGIPGEIPEVYLSSLALSPGLVSLTLCAAYQDGRFSPLASLCLPRPVNAYRNYALTPMASGVAGWVILGPGVTRTDPVSYRFSSLDQSGVLPRCAVAYPATGVPALGRPGGAARLTGLVGLVNASPAELSISVRENLPYSGPGGSGVIPRALVIGLNASDPTLLKKYAGPCGGVPDSDDCARKVIYAINDVTPDCAGAITVEFDERDVLGLNQLLAVSISGRALTLDYAMGMSDICPGVTDRFVTDQADNCDDPCDPWNTPSPFGSSS